MALTRSQASTATVAPRGFPSPHASFIPISIRFQCPLCLDVLRRPIQLPCCHRYLCMECFERGLELTSVNCGFCRRRVVGFARTKQYKVDEAMWKAIQIKCPFLGDIEDDQEQLVEFFDEEAPPLHYNNVLTTSEDTSRHQLRVHEAEQQALQRTIDSLQNDPKLTASFATSSSPMSSTSSFISPGGVKKKMKMSTTSSTSHRPVTRSLNGVDEKQPKLDEFICTTSGQSGTSEQYLCHADSTIAGISPPRTRTDLKNNELDRKYFLRSSSHSPTPTKERRRSPVKGCKLLCQLTLDTTISPIALHTRSRDLKRTSYVDPESEPSKMLTRQGRRRVSWKCAQCTYTNTCFDNRCSMCRSLPPPKAYASLSSQ